MRSVTLMDRTRLGIVVACTTGNAISMTPAVHAVFGIFLIPLATSFHWQRAAISGVLGLAAIISAIVLPLTGQYADRHGARGLALGGNLMLATAIALLSLTNGSIVQFYLTFALVAIAGSIASTALFSKVISDWFDDLVWGPDKVAREDERIRTTHNVNRTTEISADWSTINDIYEAVLPRIRREMKGITLLGGHSSHSYINGTNMYFNYFYDLIDCEPQEENDKYYLPIISIICEETLKAGGSIVHHHGIGKARTPWVKDEYGSSF